MKVTISILKGCDKCDNYKNLLKQNGIVFDELICSDNKNCEKCDKYESLSNCDTYPMTIIDNSVIMCLTTDHQLLGKIHINKQYNIVYCHSIDNMLTIAKKFIN